MKEIWKDVVDYEGLYQVSNWGRIKSLPRNGTILQPKILKIKPNKLGYLGLGLAKPTWLNKKGCNHNCSKCINQYDLQGNFIKTWSSIIEAGSMFASNRAPANISCALRKNKRKTAYGYIWKYAD